MDDPSQDFVSSAPYATAGLATAGGTAAAGALVVDALDSNFGSHLRIALELTQGSPAGNLAFTISAELDLDEEP